jgi:hypothetical protein
MYLPTTTESYDCRDKENTIHTELEKNNSAAAYSVI